MLVLALMLFVGSGSPLAAQEDVVLRQNYGVVFQKVGIIENGADVWHHTFAIPLKSLKPKLRRIRTCPPRRSASDTLVDFCKHFDEAFSSYNKLYTSIYRDILRVQEMMGLLLPKPLGMEGDMRKRGLLDIGGSIAKSLFGTATVKDVNILKQHMEELAKAVSQRDMTLKHDRLNMQSYQVTLNKRVENLNRGIKANMNIISEMTVTFQNWSSAVTGRIARVEKQARLNEKGINILHSYVAHHIHALSSLQAESYRVLDAIQTLISGYLPTYFITPQMLVELLKEISERLESQRNLRITHNHVGYYYQIPLVTYVLTEADLYIKIEIPIASSGYLFDLYRVTSMPIPISYDADKGLTRIDGHKEYIAVSGDKYHYMELDTEDILNCQGQSIKRCSAYCQ